MRLTSENKEKIRLKILDAAARLFREHGYANVNIDRLMAAANLTRGAFYAHFKSKADLFKTVILHRHGLLKQLRAREGSSAPELWAEMRHVFEEYLKPEHLLEVYKGCTLVALTEEVARSDIEVKQAYETAWNSIHEEMMRGPQPLEASQIEMALVVAVGAVNIAAASANSDQQKRILQHAWQTFCALTSIDLQLGNRV